MPLLNEADAIYLGNAQADAAYLAGHKVWPATFDPSSLAGLKTWLDAADYTTGSWPNKVTSGATPTFVGSPAPVVSTNTKNGHPLVRFNASEGRLRILAANGVHLDWTLVYVARMVGPTFGRILNAIYPPNNLLVGWWNGFKDVSYDNGFMTPNTQTSVSYGEWKMYSGDGAPGLTRFFGDGALLGTSTTSAGWGNTFAISGYAPDTDAESCDCEMAEALLYNRKLADAERGQVEAYLQTKWGL